MERSHENGRRLDPQTLVLIGAAAVLVAGLTAWAVYRAAQEGAEQEPGRRNITTTVFWVGEGATEDNAQIHNRSSTWLVDWEGAFGGVDDPDNRCDLLPCGFTPKENPFYFALPYNDLDGSCNAKPSRQEVPWYDPSNPPAEGHSIVKNRWIKIVHETKTAYAQWEDAGPFGEDDAAYVFGGKDPQSDAAGLDISPATAEYLGLAGRAKTTWQFVEEADVPDGPWKQIITRSVPDCAQ